jgi:hypothetical protein
LDALLDELCCGSITISVFFNLILYQFIMTESNPRKEPSPKKLKMSTNKPFPVKFQASLSATSEFSGIKKIRELTVDSTR